jgi:glycine oxidase
MLDCCIIGGGIIGLSIARELAGRGLSVRVLAREPARRTASWAAAGIFPPAPRHAGATPGEILTAWSDQLHRRWARELLDETGIDNGLSTCGGLHLAATAGRLEELGTALAHWQSRGSRCELLDAGGVAEVEPGLRRAIDRGIVCGGLYLPDETQMRPPRHLEALVRSCQGRGVDLSFDVTVESLATSEGRIAGILARHGDGRQETVRAARYCLAAGAWSERLARPLGLACETRPIRGQIALFQLPRPPLTRVVNVGVDYLLPRTDGRLLVGSTLEDAGFEATTTPKTIDRLRRLGEMMLGDLPEALLEQTWAGLRPGSIDGLPSIGAVPGHDNGFIAAGHFRAGLHQATGTAVLVADLITGAVPSIDPAAFAPDRPRIAREPLMPR